MRAKAECVSMCIFRNNYTASLKPKEFRLILFVSVISLVNSIDIALQYLFEWGDGLFYITRLF